MAKQQKVNKTTKNTSKFQNVRKTAAPSLNVVLRQPQPAAQLRQEGQTLRLHQKELVIKLTGLEKRWAIPLIPGKTGAPRLDHLARQHAWARWMKAPKISLRSLSQGEANGQYSYLVVHDASPSIMLDSRYWDANSRQYTSNKDSVSFTHTVPLQAMSVPQTSNQSARGTWFLIMHTGSNPAPAELWLEYDVSLGGVADTLPPPVQFRVKDGKFYEEGSDKPLDGFPIFGPESAYVFGGDPPTQQQVRQLMLEMDATPTQIVRANGETPVTTEKSGVRAAMMRVGETAGRAVNAAQDGKNALMGFLDGYSNVRKPYKEVPRRNSSPRSTNPLDQYSGTVLLCAADTVYGAYASEPSVPPIPPFVFDGNEEDKRKMPNLATYGAKKGTWSDALQIVGESALGQMVETVINNTIGRQAVVHKGMHAIAFTRQYSAYQSDEPPKPGTDPEGNNPNLPDIPDFDEDVEAPGTIVNWAAAQISFSGAVVNKSGTPSVRFLASQNPAISYFTAPTPKYYTKIRRPWDKEDKYLLALQQKVSLSLQGHYLLMEGYNWGEDGCVSWLNTTKGATYLGTVAVFSGITMSRSVIRIDDVDAWNESDVHLVVGQRKPMLAGEEPEARFQLRIGAVGTHDVAINYLGCWSQHPSFSRIKNHPKHKSNPNLPSHSINIHKDFSFKTRRSLDPSLDPASPGFLQNYKSLVSGTRQLPFPVEAGPVYIGMMARYDDANGWWQHIPDAFWTDTDIASKWLGQINLEGELVDFGQDCRKAPITFTLTPPQPLSEGAYLCVETQCVGIDSGCDTLVVVQRGSDWIDNTYKVAIGGPITRYRTIWKIKKGDKIIFHSRGNTQRHAESVDSYPNDFYMTFLARAYLVKHELVAKTWVFWDDNENPTYDPGYWIKRLYKVNPSGSSEPWEYSTIMCKPDGWGFANSKQSYHYTNLYQATGYSRTAEYTQVPQDASDLPIEESADHSLGNPRRQEEDNRTSDGHASQEAA